MGDSVFFRAGASGRLNGEIQEKAMDQWIIVLMTVIATLALAGWMMSARNRRGRPRRFQSG